NRNNPLVAVLENDARALVETLALQVERLGTVAFHEAEPVAIELSPLEVGVGKWSGRRVPPCEHASAAVRTVFQPLGQRWTAIGFERLKASRRHNPVDFMPFSAWKIQNISCHASPNEIVVDCVVSTDRQHKTLRRGVEESVEHSLPVA